MGQDDFVDGGNIINIQNIGSIGGGSSSGNESTFLEDSVISKTMNALAEQAYYLSKKYDLQDEASIIE